MGWTQSPYLSDRHEGWRKKRKERKAPNQRLQSTVHHDVFRNITDECS